MTREEAKAYAKRVIDLGLNDETQAFCEVVLKALEQEPVLDKIRAEIRNEQNMDYKCHRKTYDNCLRIIDKYKAEIEPRESEDKG